MRWPSCCAFLMYLGVLFASSAPALAQPEPSSQVMERSCDEHERRLWRKRLRAVTKPACQILEEENPLTGPGRNPLARSSRHLVLERAEAELGHDD